MSAIVLTRMTIAGERAKWYNVYTEPTRAVKGSNDMVYNREKQVGYSRKWRDAHPENKAKKDATYRAKRREIIYAAKSAPCADCHTNYPTYVMDFDHLDPSLKEFEVGRGLYVSIKRLEAEIAKCEVVCANCHRERTHGEKDEWSAN